MTSDIIAYACKYSWLWVIAFFGGSIGYLRKYSFKHKENPLLERFYYAALSIVTSMFTAYITYEIIIYATDVENISIALAGLASFLGSDLLITAEKALLSIISETISRKISKK